MDASWSYLDYGFFIAFVGTLLLKFNLNSIGQIPYSGRLLSAMEHSSEWGKLAVN